MNNTLVAKQNKASFREYISSPNVQKMITTTLGDPTRCLNFTSSIISAFVTNPALEKCDFGSVVSAALIGETLKLSPSPMMGHYYLVPFENKKQGKTIATFQIGYKGYIQLAMRSGQYKKISVLEVREGEFIGRNPENGDYLFKFIEDEEVRETRNVIGYMGSFELINGYRQTIYWSKEKMLKHADRYSQAFSINATSGKFPKVSYADYLAGKVPESDMWLYSSFWYKDFDGMAFKTILRQLISKWGIMSVDMEQAFTKDMTYTDQNGNQEYFDSPSSDNELGYVEQKQIAQKEVNVAPAVEAPKEEKATAPTNLFGEVEDALQYQGVATSTNKQKHAEDLFAQYDAFLNNQGDK